MEKSKISIRPLDTKLADFPIETVKKTATDFNKSFHSKIFTLFAASESELHAFSAKSSPHYGYCFAFMKGDEGRWFLDWEGVRRVRDWIVGEIESGRSRTIFDIHNAWRKDWAGYEATLRLIDGTKLSILSDKDFYTLFGRFYVGYLLAGSVAYMADTFMSTGETDWLEEKISGEVSRAGVDEGELRENVRLLTNPLVQSYTIEAEWKLAAIGGEIEKLYPKTFPTFAVLREKHSEVAGLLDYHARNFFWIRNNYFNVETLDAEHFYRELEKKVAGLRSVGSTFRVTLERRDKEQKEIGDKRDALLRTLRLSENARELLRVAWLFAEWKDVRKKGSYIGMHYFDLFLTDLARRASYTKEDLTFLVFGEVAWLLFEKHDFSSVISKRRKQAFFAVTPEGYYVVGGREADKYFNLEARDDRLVSELKGVPACRGVARGKVRIIRKTEEMKLFERGEILVTNQTTPEFVPIMRKAAAIVTEQGGITSHAAVISRELGVPCVIGIKIATKVLKDGDVVEVNADTGVVKILERK